MTGMPYTSRGPVRRALLCAAALALAAPALAQGSWRPRRPIRIVVPFSPGGATDILARQIAQKVGNGLGQPFIVENRPGGNGVVGTQVLLTSPPDGHNLIMASADTHTVLPFANPRLPYDVSTFVPVNGAAYTVFGLVARSGLPAADVGEVVALAKRASPPLTYASYGIASTSHVAGEMFKMLTGVDMTHVPYQGSGPATMAVAAGEVDVGLVPIAIAHPQRDRLRLLGVATGERFAMVPELPTLAEQGVRLVADAWIGLLAAPGTPREIAETINAAVSEVLGTPEMRASLQAAGFSVMSLGPDRFAAFLAEESGRWGSVVRAAHISIAG
ncbi:tripartite tricarboxylate transporter substrate binding protein [Pararoseomonas indoligenes]|uniref:Tripartite tricarboxylate transporter substrate binding protein n=1 Tax=Roseomonas indoligenes TaxID=2820811 RepID=A0A940MZI2_9PROT|nr:tripartite tricarboxylate transporter substrate binding protein [Pararoseomonas indoligenes]MBP0495051.1 tripartite tricarboxylate transporter substrate binding protein [Pararoseomonas indoligenes]